VRHPESHSSYSNWNVKCYLRNPDASERKLDNNKKAVTANHGLTAFSDCIIAVARGAANAMQKQPVRGVSPEDMIAPGAL